MIMNFRTTHYYNKEITRDEYIDWVIYFLKIRKIFPDFPLFCEYFEVANTGNNLSAYLEFCIATRLHNG